jgi:hypothetical protein
MDRLVSIGDSIISSERGEQRQRHNKAKYLCSLQVNDQLEFGRLLYGQIGGRSLNPILA